MRNFFYKKGDFQPVYLFITLLHTGWITCLVLAAIKIISENFAAGIIAILITASQSSSYAFNQDAKNKMALQDAPKIP